MKSAHLIAAFLLTILSAQAQNLIVNGNFEAGNTSFTNDYRYAPARMTDAGTYTITDNPSSVHGAWASFGDHTTGSGQMLVSNGDANPTNVVWRQTITTAPNTAYLFSAWAASSYPENPAQFYFFVSGVQQGAPVAIPSTLGQWQNYSILWDSAGAQTALLEIRMLTTAFAGNDFVLDDLSFRSVSSTTPRPPLTIEPAVEVRWPTVTNQLYQVQWASHINTNQWFDFGAAIVGNGKTNSICDPLGSFSKRFYRVIPID